MQTPWRTDKWFVSPWNYLSEVVQSLQFPDRIQVHDLTLRDGEQEGGIVFTRKDKVRIAEKLAEMGVHRIEAGTPVVSTEDEAAVREIARRRLGPKTFALIRCMVEDVLKAADCGIDGAIIEIPCSEHLVRYGYRWPLEKAIDLSIAATRAAHERGLYVVFFPIDSTRSDIDWYLNLIERVASEGHMDALALVDTTGTLSPHAVPLMVKSARARIKNRPLEVHFHNDFGHGVGNTIAALAAGAEVAHLTICGMGERAGNASLEETVMSLLLQYGIDLGLKYDRLREVGLLVQELGGHRAAQNKPIIGDTLFDVESGIIAEWWYNCRDEHLLEVFPFRPELVGHKAPSMVYSKLSGRSSVLMLLEKMRVKADEAQCAEILLRIKEQSIREKAPLTEAEVGQIVEHVVARSS